MSTVHKSHSRRLLQGGFGKKELKKKNYQKEPVILHTKQNLVLVVPQNVSCLSHKVAFLPKKQ